MMADPHEDKVLLRMKREAVTTQEPVTTTQKQGTDKALLGGLIFLALILVAIIVAVLLVWWFYCRRASRRAKKYRADSDSVYKAYQRKEEKKRIEKQKRENPPIRENIFANFVTSQEHSEEGTSTGMLSVNHLMRVQYREDPEKGTGEKSNKYSRHADYLTEDQDERITARASVHIEAEPKISLNEKASEKEKHNGRDIGSKAHQRTDETDGRDRNIPSRSERYVDGAENEEQYAIIEKQQLKPQYLEHSMKGDRYSEDKEVYKNNTESEIKDLDAKKSSLKSEQTSRNGGYSPEDKNVNKDNTKDDFEDNDFDFHHESRSPPAASIKVPSVHTDDQTAESGTDSESETDSYTCTSDSHPSDYYEDEHDVSVTSLGDHAGVFQKTWAEKGSSLPVDIRNMNYDGNVVFESVDVYCDNGDTTLTMSDSDLDVTSESDDDDGPETKSNGLVNNGKISEIEALNELDKAVQDHSSPVRDPPLGELPSRDIQMLPPLHQNQKLPPINVDIKKNKDTKSRRNDKERDDKELKMRQRHGSGESIEKSGRRRHVSEDFGDGKIRLRERSSSLSRISSEVKRDSSTVRKSKDDLDGALAARRHVNNSLNNSFRDREKSGDPAKKKERPTSGKQRQGHRQTRRQSTGDLLSNGTAEKHESELTEKGHSVDNSLKTHEKSRHKQSGHREHRDRSEHHGEGEHRHRRTRHRDNDGKTSEDKEHSQHRHRPSKEHRSRHGNDAEYLARKQRHEERKRQRMEDPEAAEQYRKQQEAKRLRHQRKKEGHDGEKTFSERYRRSKENQHRHRDETEEERRQRHKEKVERHRRHHQANSEKKKKPKEDATDDLALTLHADDELYQMHKLTLPLDNSLNSTGGFSVDKNTKNRDHSKKEHRKREKDMSSNFDVNQKHATDVHEEIFNHRQIAVSAPVFADLIMDNESFEV